MAVIDVEIRDLESLGKACEKLGLQLNIGQKTHRWYGASVGDYPLPTGFTADELGKCEHAISVRGNDGAYEIGVVKRRDGRPGWTLLWDFYAQGYGLEQAVGKDAQKLRQRYAAEVAIKNARKQGFRVQEKMVGGKIRITATR